MTTLIESAPTESAQSSDFIDRRQASGNRTDGPERRQFQDARRSGCAGAVELAEAVDQYKLQHRRRFITYEELYNVVVSLGYHK